MKRTNSAIVVMLALSFMPPANAQARSEALEIITSCELAMEADEDISTFAIALSELRGLGLAPPDRFRGMACLREHFGERYFFDNQSLSFISASEHSAPLRAEEEALRVARCQILDELADLRPQLLEMEALAGLAEYQMELAAIALRSETLGACRDWYARDHFSALTNPVCAEYLEQYGAVAPAGIDDYDPMELHTLQAQVSRLEADLLIIDSGTLPEVARMERLEQLRLIAIIALPEELQQQAQDLSLEEIEALRVEYERSLCD